MEPIIREIGGDGNCLFRAISFCVYASEDHHFEVKSRAVKEIVHNWNDYSPFIIGDRAYEHQIIDTSDYENLMLLDGKHGGYPEIVAASALFPDFQFRVYREGNDIPRNAVECVRGREESLGGQKGGRPKLERKRKSLRNFRESHEVKNRVRHLRNVVKNDLRSHVLETERRTRKNSDSTFHPRDLSGNDIPINAVECVGGREDSSGGQKGGRPKLKRKSLRNFRVSREVINRVRHLRNVVKYDLRYHAMEIGRRTGKNSDSFFHSWDLSCNDISINAAECVARDLSCNNDISVNAVERVRGRGNSSGDQKGGRSNLTRKRKSLRALRESEEVNNRVTYLRCVESLFQGSSTENRLRPWNAQPLSAFSYTESLDYAKKAAIGKMCHLCEFCNALKFSDEPKGLCCSSGKVILSSLRPPPEPLQSLLNGEHVESKHFMHQIRAYNSAFQMTSFGATEISEGHFMPTFKIQGQVYHLIGSLLPPNKDVSKYLQIYFVSDYRAQVDIRMSIIPTLKRELVTQLQEMLHGINPYVVSFKSALESIPQANISNFKIVINADKKPPNEHRGCYNEPSTNEVAVLMVGENCDNRDIVLRMRDNKLKRISETHRSYDALQYPLMIPYGEDGRDQLFAVLQKFVKSVLG
ncbi:hypothetical protein BC332_34617 [Capsicum chinense]|nr:hypothetical protein BC332_34617 [Capsicum chinense]